MVCSADGSSRFDHLGYSSLLNPSKESPQATLCTRQTSFSSTSEKNITNECVLIRWNSSGTFGKMQFSLFIMLYFYLCCPKHTHSFSSSFHHFVAFKATKWRLFSVGKALSGVPMWAQRAVLSPKRGFYGIWSASPEMILMPKTNFGSGVTENAKPLMSADVSWHLQQRWRGLGMLWECRW